MFCPNCAKEVQPELNYCNSCGFRIDGASKSEAGLATNHLSKALGWIGVIGLGAFVFVLRVLLQTEIEPGAVVVIAFFYLAALFGICYSLLNLIKSTLVEKKAKREPQFEPPGEISGRRTNQLEPARTTPASVTEHTTRTLDKVPVKNE